MRFTGLMILLPVLAGICMGQDTNFSAGPQYLITGDPMLLHSIATPSLILGAPLPAVPETAAPAENQPYTSNPGLEKEADLFPIYYGYTRVNEIELTTAEETQPVPASITGVTGSFTTAEALRELGYGIPLGDVSTYWKAHRTAPRTYTNADIQRLRPN